MSAPSPPDLAAVYPDARPYTRWWWFSGPIEQAHLRAQLDWLAAHGFGGVEIAWIYPQPGAPIGPPFLSSEWTSAVAAARQYALSIGLGCDLTFGTLWPFGGSFVAEADASRTFRGPSEQRLGRSWELPHAPPGRILNHLDAAAFDRYAAIVGSAARPALSGRPAALFCDSWEVEGADLWSDGFAEDFRARFGYDIQPYMTDLDASPAARYDYRDHLAERVLDAFYRPLARACHALGAAARVQCHGSPTDLLAAYAVCDVPESEAVLFDPPFSRLAASAAAFTGSPLVSAEAFTCLYGWRPYPGPGPHQGQERLADLRLCADALVANGINLLVWHGTPQSPPGGGQRFYASVHVGPDAAFVDRLAAFNAYLTQVCGRMRRGRPAFDLGVYLPLEDAWMRGALPPELRRPSAGHYWELQTERMPTETLGYRPVWISGSLLANAIFEDGVLRCGALALRAFYVDVEWLTHAALAHLLRLARAGLPVCLKRRPQAPGLVAGGGYEADLDRLVALPSVRATLRETSGLGGPVVEGADPPEYACRTHPDGQTFFFANPASRLVTYPMAFGAGDRIAATERRVEIRLPVTPRGPGGATRVLTLPFPPGQSVFVEIDASGSARVEPLPLPDDSRD